MQVTPVLVVTLASSLGAPPSPGVSDGAGRGYTGPTEVVPPELVTAPPWAIPGAAQERGRSEVDGPARGGAQVEPERGPGEAPRGPGPAGATTAGSLGEPSSTLLTREALERRISGELRSGVVLTAVGLTLGIGAIILGAVDACAPAAGNSCNEDAQRRAVWTLGAPSIGLLAAGVSYLGVALHGRRKLRAGVVAQGDLWGARLTAHF